MELMSEGIQITPMALPLGAFVYLAAGIKEVVDIPVIGVGGIQTAEEADNIILSGRVDLVAVGRAYLSEPRWATIAAEELSRG